MRRPVFLSKKEARAIFVESTRSQGQGFDSGLTFAGMLHALIEIAEGTLSKPAYSHLYPTLESKLTVVLEVWGLADAVKLQEVSLR